MADQNYIDRTAEVKVVGQDATGNTVNYVSADANGNLFVKDYSDGPVTPGAVASTSSLAGGQFNTSLPTLTNTQQSAIQLDSSGRLIISPLTSSSIVTVSNFPTTVDTNYGTVGASTIRTASQIGNATGAADFNAGAATAQTLRVTAANFPTTLDTNYGTVGASTLRTASQIGNATGAAAFNAGTTSAQTLRVVLPTDQTAIPASQSGTWTTGRTWTLASGTDSVSVVQSTSPWVTKDQSDGPVTPGTVASFSQLAGGQFNTALPTLTNGQQSALQLDSSGKLFVNVSGSSVGVADESAFTYGTTNQTVVGGVYQDTSPTLTAGQQGAIRLTQYRAQHINLRNSSGVEVSSSNNGNANQQLLNTQVPDTTTASTALGALNASIQITMAGLASVGFQILAGTLIGTITPECSVDGGTTWAQASFYDPSSSTVTTTLVFGSANTTKILSILPIGGSSHVRVRVSLYTSGTANSVLRASQVTGSAGAVTAAAFGTVNNTSVSLPGNTATLLLAANPNRKYAYISNVGGATLNIQFGSSTGLSATVGLIITSKSFYELKGDNLYTGNVYGFCASNQTISVTEGTP